MDVKITIKNLPQIRAAFAKAPHIIGPKLDRAIKTSVLLVGRRSRVLTPVDTGRLRASTRETFRPMYGEVGTFTNYDIFVHEGTRFMKARPYMRNAVEQVSPSIQSVFEKELQSALNDIGRMT